MADAGPPAEALVTLLAGAGHRAAVLVEVLQHGLHVGGGVRGDDGRLVHDAPVLQQSLKWFCSRSSSPSQEPPFPPTYLEPGGQVEGGVGLIEGDHPEAQVVALPLVHIG